jgi:hypothetical protein
MERRELLKTIAILTGATLVGGTAFFTGCKEKSSAGRTLSFTDADVALLDEISNTILPDTPNSPGAKAAKTGAFMKVYVTDCYEPADQDIFLQGVAKINEDCKKATGKTFMECDAAKRTEFLNALDKEAKEQQKKKDEAWKQFNEKNGGLSGEARDKAIADAQIPGNHYFTLMKQLTITGYFSSEIGMTTARRHEPVPGRYDGNYPYKKGDRAWAE